MVSRYKAKGRKRMIRKKGHKRIHKRSKYGGLSSFATNGGTTSYLNVEKNLKPHWIAKTTYACFTIAANTAAGSYLWDFDPIGNAIVPSQGSVIDNVGAGHTTPLPLITDTAAFQSLFDEYTVRKIVVTAKLIDTSTGVGTNVLILGRYNYDGTATPASINVQEIANVKQHMFTNEHSVCTYPIYPKVERLTLVNNGVSVATGTIGRQVTKMGWLDIDRSVAVNGFFMYQPGTGAGQSIVFDVTYYMGFRYHA